MKAIQIGASLCLLLAAAVQFCIASTNLRQPDSEVEFSHQQTTLENLHTYAPLAIGNNSTLGRAVLVGIYVYGLKDVVTKTGGIFKEFHSTKDMMEWLKATYPERKLVDKTQVFGRTIKKQKKVELLAQAQKPLITCHTTQISKEYGAKEFFDPQYYNKEVAELLRKDAKQNFLAKGTKAFCHTSPDPEGHSYPTFDVESTLLDETTESALFECHGPNYILSKPICHALQIYVLP